MWNVIFVQEETQDLLKFPYQWFLVELLQLSYICLEMVSALGSIQLKDVFLLSDHPTDC